MAAALTITSGPDTGKVFPLGDTQIIGRVPRCAIQIHDTRASREHARVYRSEGRFHIVDLNSKNGIAVNGEAVQRAALSPGDAVVIGDTWLRIDYSEDDVAPRTVPANDDPFAAAPLPASADVKLRAKDGTGRISDQPLRSTASQRTTGRTRGSHAPTRTSLAWLRTDLAQVSGLYKALMLIGLLVLVLGLGYLAFRFTSS